MGVRPVEYFAGATREVIKTISEKCQLLHEMNRVFEQLQSTFVDPSMVGGEQGKTLFDFIDADTVQSLQQDALEQTKE
ncbi:NADH dehydrogenase iron-sulfur protein 7 [Phytophthora nicotianae]|nr:NADH dehydrogenase iron-sulfur protein 7 [Phytophthora nicotianae]